jgi:hypothetical protein
LNLISGAAQVVTESRSEMSQFQYLEQKTQVRQVKISEQRFQFDYFIFKYVQNVSQDFTYE